MLYRMDALLLQDGLLCTDDFIYINAIIYICSPMTGKIPRQGGCFHFVCVFVIAGLRKT